MPVFLPVAGISINLFLIVGAGGLVGFLSGLLGVGGGFIMVPMMVYLLRMPAHKAVGTDLFQILFTCAGVTFMQAAVNQTVDLLLAVLIAAGSTIGAQIGARVSRIMRGEQLLIILASLALLVVLRMSVSILLPPSSVLSPARAEGHASLHYTLPPPAAQRAHLAPAASGSPALPSVWPRPPAGRHEDGASRISCLSVGPAPKLWRFSHA